MKKFILVFLSFVFVILASEGQAGGSKILVFDDPGAVNPQLFPEVLSMMKARFPTYKVESISAALIKHSHWEDDAVMLVLPGGTTTRMEEVLKQEGKKSIQDYVKFKKGNVLAICAGAFLSARTTIYDDIQEGAPLKRYGLIPCDAKGPTFETIGLKPLCKHGKSPDAPPVAGYYAKGGHFVAPAGEMPKGLTFLYDFVDPRKPAIVEYKPESIPRAHQHGTVLATQIHPEFDYVNEEGTLAYDLLSRFNLPKISDDEEHFE